MVRNNTPASVQNELRRSLQSDFDAKYIILVLRHKIGACVYTFQPLIRLCDTHYGALESSIFVKIFNRESGLIANANVSTFLVSKNTWP